MRRKNRDLENGVQRVRDLAVCIVTIHHDRGRMFAAKLKINFRILIFANIYFYVDNFQSGRDSGHVHCGKYP